jgi:hypothetical protein
MLPFVPPVVNLAVVIVPLKRPAGSCAVVIWPLTSVKAGWLNCGTPLVLIELTHWCDIALTASTPPNALRVGLGS